MRIFQAEVILPTTRAFPTLPRGYLTRRACMQRTNDRKWAAWAVGLLLVMMVPLARADDWPQWLGPKRDGVWREKGILDKFPPGGPKVRWRVGVGAGYSGPAVAGGRVFVTDHLLADGVKLGGGFDMKPLAGTERV